MARELNCHVGPKPPVTVQADVLLPVQFLANTLEKAVDGGLSTWTLPPM